MRSKPGHKKYAEEGGGHKKRKSGKMEREIKNFLFRLSCYSKREETIVGHRKNGCERERGEPAKPDQSQEEVIAVFGRRRFGSVVLKASQGKRVGEKGKGKKLGGKSRRSKKY